MTKYLSLIFLIATLFLARISFSQSFNSSSKSMSSNWELNYGIGFSQFYGDASNSGYFQKFSGELGLGQNINIKKHFNPVFALGLNAYYGCVKSHKTSSESGSVVDFILQGSYVDFNLRSYINLSNLFWGYNKNRNLNLYGWLGLGYGFWKTGLTDNIGGTYVESGNNIGATTDIYKKGGAVVPIGIGINYRIADNWAINIVGDYRTVLNDDLDVWKGGFKYDQMFFTSIGISYYINPGFGKRKSKTKSKTVEPVKTESKAIKKEETLKPDVSSPKVQNKIISDVPIYDLDYSASRHTIKEESINKAEPEMLIIEPKINNQPIAGIVYRVQIMAMSKKLSDANYLKNKYNLSDDIFEVFQDGVYRYSVGAFNSYAAALDYSRTIKNKGVTDAFVVVYKDGKRIPLTSNLK